MQRPFSVCCVLSIIGDRIRVIIKVAGLNTAAYAGLKPGDEIKIFGPKGNPIPLDPKVERYILVAGGIGGAALMPSAKELGLDGKTVNFLLGVKEPSQIFGIEELKAIGCCFQIIAERDAANTGVVTDLLKESLASDEGRSTIIACGPVVMLKRIAEMTAESGNKCLVLLEEIMACGGVGSCKGCAVFGKDGTVKYVCKDGPAFDASWVDWERMMRRYEVTPPPRSKKAVDPLKTVLTGQGNRTLRLATPIMNAAGCLDIMAIEGGWVNTIRAGALIPKSVTLGKRPGNDGPRTCEVKSGMLNAIGLAGDGVEEFCEKDLPRWLSFGPPVIANIAGSTVAEYVKITQRLANTGVAAFKVNISCPNVRGGLAFGVDPVQTSEVVKAIREVAPNMFLIVKLTPTAGFRIVDVARAAKEAGADAIAAINTLPGMAIDVYIRKPKIGRGFGGMSGPAIHAHAVKVVYDLAQADLGIPIIGIGGNDDGESAMEMILAGASVVEVGTGLFGNGNAMSDMHDFFLKMVSYHQVSHIRDLIGQWVL
ncbi:MAG: dihydroorotate dehydrogenase [Patescibacteria group bacterium]